MKKIESLSEELFNKIMKRWKGKLDKSFISYLEEEIRNFNKETKEIIEDLITKQLSPPMIGKTETLLLTGVLLSKSLHHNSINVQKQTLLKIKEHLKRVSTIKVITKAFYDGYKLKEKDILDINKMLPKYLFGNVDAAKIQATVLKTKPLKAAYLQLLNSKNDAIFQKNLSVALKEKSRFNAQRIADTEEQRAFNFSNADNILKDDEVELVKYELSSKHKHIDLCDYYANLDIGYGPGIIPKEQMITLPLHPFCFCRYKPHFRKVKFNQIKNPEKATLDKFSDYEQTKILGSQYGKQRFDSGDGIETIFNMNRPKFPIVKVKELFG